MFSPQVTEWCFTFFISVVYILESSVSSSTGSFSEGYETLYYFVDLNRYSDGG